VGEVVKQMHFCLFAPHFRIPVEARSRHPPEMEFSELLNRAKDMRRNPTDAELRLWSVLRGTRLENHKFHRQVPIGTYIVDFLCRRAALIVEVDGSQHMSDIAYDSARSKWLQDRGYRVLRFWNNEVLLHTDAVAAKIFEALDGKGLTPESGRVEE
jgi:very-short-patch-repair endonuclease